MAKLLNDLFLDEGQQKYIGIMKEEELSRSMMFSQAHDELMMSREILVFHSYDQILAMMSHGEFDYSDEECCNVAKFFYDVIKCKDFLPFVTEQSGVALGERCLISLGLFKDYMLERTNRYGAPRPSFYREVGRRVLKEEGLVDVSRYFNQWEFYLRKTFSHK